MRGWRATTQGRHDEAEKVFATGLALPPQLLERADRRRMLVMMAELLETTGAARREQPRLARALELAMELLKDLDRSKVVFEQDQRWRAAMVVGNVLYRDGRTQEAEPFFRKVLDQRPAHTGAMNNLAAILQDTADRLPEAVAIYEAALLIPAGRRDKMLLNSYGASVSWSYCH